MCWVLLEFSNDVFIIRMLCNGLSVGCWSASNSISIHVNDYDCHNITAQKTETPNFNHNRNYEGSLCLKKIQKNLSTRTKPIAWKPLCLQMEYDDDDTPLHKSFAVK